LFVGLLPASSQRIYPTIILNCSQAHTANLMILKATN
jgi:hypothetical protein